MESFKASNFRNVLGPFTAGAWLRFVAFVFFCDEAGRRFWTAPVPWRFLWRWLVDALENDPRAGLRLMPSKAVPHGRAWAGCT
jgi:hypothetical protein